MKTSEMIAALEKNPKLRFRNGKDYIAVRNGFIYFERKTDQYPGGVVPDSVSGGNWNGNVNVDTNWQLVRESVPGWEAIKALTEGKTLECDYNGGISKIKPNDRGGLSIQSLRRGTWYIEEGE
jgi:hypothetical protein